MTINEIKMLFTTATKIYAVNDILDADEEVIGKDKMEITDLLYGSSGFGNLEVGIRAVEVIGKNKVEIDVRMPQAVFEAWKKYNDDYYQHHYSY